jgi:dipeptidyl aminopeptidase/acylaminoacyl peptidase
MRTQKTIWIAVAAILLAAGWLAAGNAETAGPISQVTPTPFPVDQYTVLSVTDYDLMAGPGATSAYLAPDGERFAHFTREQICVYTAPGELPLCVTGDERLRGIDLETVRWSPDSRYLAFTQEFFQTFRDPDLWVLDTNTGDLRNLTDDDTDRVPLLDPNADWGNVDLLPRWSGDSARILFLRYSGGGGEVNPPELFTIAPDGSDLRRVGVIETAAKLPVYALDWSPDGTQVAYNYWAPDEEANNGIWFSNLDGSNARQVIQIEPGLVPAMVEFSADGQYLLTFTPQRMTYQVTYDQPEQSPVRVISVESGESLLASDEYWASGAGWSPSGHGLISLLRNDWPNDPRSTGVYLSNAPGEPGVRILNGAFSPPTSVWWHTLTWATNDTILLSRSPERGVVVVRLGVE